MMLKKDQTAEEELARELEESRDDPGEWSEEVSSVEVRPTGSQVVSFRLPLEELEEITTAIGETGESVSAFIRGAIALRLRIGASAPVARMSGPLPSSVTFSGRNEGEDSVELPLNSVAMGGSSR